MCTNLERNNTGIRHPDVCSTVDLQVSIDDTILLPGQHRGGTTWVPDTESALSDVCGQFGVGGVGKRVQLASDEVFEGCCLSELGDEFDTVNEEGDFCMTDSQEISDGLSGGD